MNRIFKVAVIVIIMDLGLFFGCAQSQSSSLEGSVVDGKGQPMANVKMVARQVEPLKGYDLIGATTGGNGKFVIKGLFPNSAYVIVAVSDKKLTSVRLDVRSGPAGQTKMLPKPINIRFTKAQDGSIGDNATGLEWYVGPNQQTTWSQAKGWTESLNAAGGGWRMPTIAELKTIYQPGSGPNNMDPLFQATGPWVWSGQLRDKSSAWAFDFGNGQVAWNLLLKAPVITAPNGRAFAVRSQK